jgi:glycosyltransferase involved in cell wall biosynthesis
MPCYNAAPYVGAALDSVLAQTWRRLEVIVVDDGSTDGSSTVLTSYANRGVRVIHQENAGQCAAANRAYAAASGAYIKFFDADDIMAPDMIERQIERLAGRRDAVALGEWARFTRDDPPTSARFTPLAMYRDAKPVDWLVQEWSNAAPMMQCALWLIPRDILERRGLWDERLSLINDFEFIARVLLGAADILFTPGARLYYRSGLRGSLAGTRSRKAVESAFLALMLGTSHLFAAEDSPRTRRACANVLQDFDYAHYPAHADLREKVRARIAELGGSDLAPGGPPGFPRLRRLFGWRAARRVQHLAERLRLNRAARRPLVWRRHRASGAVS